MQNCVAAGTASHTINAQSQPVGETAVGLRDEVQKVVDEILNPALGMHGGGVEVVDVDENEGVVTVRMIGACHG